MAEATKLYGYVGKILRINLTDNSTESISTSKYIPKYLGGRSLCNKIFWDEVGPGVGAFDPGNKIIFMTGATTGTGIPTGGRAVMAGISPNSLPEQYSYGSVGGWVGTVLKYAGYDGLILEGKAPQPCYIFIEDDNISFLSAEPMWGMLVHDSQNWIRDTHGANVQSLVIGPAGENLCRNACVTTSSDNTLGKSGFGAVFGSKNLKGIAIKGSGAVYPADIEKVFELRARIGDPLMIPNKIERCYQFGPASNAFDVPEGYDICHMACSAGCNSRCNTIHLNTISAFGDSRINQVEMCVSSLAYNFSYDLVFDYNLVIHSQRNNRSIGNIFSYGGQGQGKDKSDPDLDVVNKVYMGDKMELWGPDFDRGNLITNLCNEYGIDKWDFSVWYLTWLAMAKKEGLLDDLDFGMEPDVENPEFIKHFITIVIYRKGIGDLLAEGMARAIRKLGKEKYGDTIYRGRFNQDGQQLDIPVSLESGWGHCAHWQGRGFQATPKWLWIASALTVMLSTRDALGSSHFHDTPENYRKYHEDPSRSELLISNITLNDHNSEIKDSVTSCEWQAPNLFWPDMEIEMYRAATGIEISLEELYTAAERSKLLFRAILMRNFGRDRDMEVNEIYPYLTYPDPWGEKAEWDEWNDTVDLYYKARGWDLQTGWPTKSAWDKVGLSDIANEMDRLDKLPPEGRTTYTRSPNPIGK